MTLIIRISIGSHNLILQNMYKSQAAYPASPLQAYQMNESLSHELDNLCLVSRKSSETETITGCILSQSTGKQKHLKKLKRKNVMNKQKYESIKKKRENTIKKLKYQQNKIQELEREVNSLRRKCQNCFNCRSDRSSQIPIFDDCQMILQEEMLRERFASGCGQRNSKQSLEFQAIDFSQSLAWKEQMDDRAWVMLGTIMIIMGSKNMEIDGTINTFKIINDCVDSVRRQVQKSADKISVDFYFMKEEMKQPNIMQGLDFDPFFTKTQKNGLHLEGLNVESIEQFELAYDEKIKFSVDYEALIGTIERLKQNCWVCH